MRKLICLKPLLGVAMVEFSILIHILFIREIFRHENFPHALGISHFLSSFSSFFLELQFAKFLRSDIYVHVISFMWLVSNKKSILCQFSILMKLFNLEYRNLSLQLVFWYIGSEVWLVRRGRKRVDCLRYDKM